MTGVIFDFDGTLIQSHRAIYDVIVRLTRHRAPPPTPEELWSMGTRELLVRLRVPAWQLPWFVFRARRALRARIDEFDFEPGLIEVIRSLRESGVRLALVSSNSKANVLSCLTRHGCDGLFDVVIGGAPMLGKHRALRRAVRALGLPVADVISVGDEVRDVEAAARVGLRAVAVGWGLNAPALLTHARPWALVHSPTELTRVLAAGSVGEGLGELV